MIYIIVFIVLFLVGFYSVLTEKSLIKMVIGLNIMEAAIFFWFITGANRGGVIPIYQRTMIEEIMNDPVPQALVLTGIVIGASTTAFLLTLIIELNKFADNINIQEIEGLDE